MLNIPLNNEKEYEKIKAISNRNRFKIIEITQNKELSISAISKEINLSYNKCADYVAFLEKANLVEKKVKGREVLIKSKVKISSDKIQFECEV